MKLIIGIIININDDLNLSKNSWIKLYNNKCDYYFFIDSDINEETDKYIKIKDINHFKILSWLKKKKNQWTMIVNHDSFINVNNLLKYLDDIKETEALYIGGHGDNRQIGNINFYFHSYTCGIILNEKSLERLGDESLFIDYNNICKRNNSDLINLSGVAIGFFSCLFNFKLLNCNNIWYCNCWGHACHINIPNIKDIISCGQMSKTDLNYMTTFLTDNKKIIIAPDGGLGNLIFQYLYGMSIAKKYDYEILFYKNYNYWRGNMDNYKLFNNCIFIEEHNVDINNYVKVFEKLNYSFKEDDFDINLNYIIHGHYQSYKYSIKYIDEFKNNLFQNISTEYNLMKLYFNSIKKNKTTCLLHVRRGDYLKYPNIHPVCSDTYYTNAIEIMNINTQFIIFSDDIPYIKNWKLLKNLDYTIIEENNPVNILILMTLCDNYIIANSTLSLCGYLFRENKNGILISPKKWFGPQGPKYNITDIIPSESIVIDE